LTKPPIRVVAYVLRSYPEPSETFISEEAASLLDHGITPCILHILEGTSAVRHPTNQALLEHAPVRRVGKSTRREVLSALARWLVARPIGTLLTLGRALRHPNRWCYFQALSPAWWCRRQRVEFLHAHFADTNFQYAAAMSDWSGIPFGVTTHGYDLRETPLGLDVTADLLKRASVIVTVSRFNLRLMAERYRLAASDVQVIHCGIDVQRFAYRPDRPRLGDQPFRLLNVGRLVPEKAQDVLLRALALVRDRGVRFQLDMVGGGPLEESLRALARELKLEQNVVFHGTQPESLVRQLHGDAQAFILSSRSEGLPVACIEALAMGTPTIATRITGIPELIEDGVSGILVPPDDAAALSDAICRLLSTPDAAKVMQERGRATVLAKFDRGQCTKRLVDLWTGARSRPPSIRLKEPFEHP
jgi:colanic acid/amylovoran biosynthesis glycosyltransferase